MWHQNDSFKRLLLTLAFATSTFALGAPAAEENPAWKVPGKWRPWSMVATGDPDNAKCATRSEWAAWETNLKKIRALWQQMPAIASPVGYEISADGAYPTPGSKCMHMVRQKEHKRGERPSVRFYDTTEPLGGSVSFYPFPYIAVSPKLEVDHETLPIYFNVNHIPGNNLPLLEDLFVEPTRVMDRFGLPAFLIGNRPCIFVGEDACPRDDTFLVVKNNEAPLWKPVPLLDVYDQMLDRVQYEVEALEIIAERNRARLEDSLSEKEHIQREKSCRELSLMQKKVVPEDYVVNCQKNTQRYEEQLRKDIANLGPRPDNQWTGWLAGIERITELRKQLLETNPKAFAYMCSMPHLDFSYSRSKVWVTEYAEQFKAESGPQCRAVVKKNGDYFNRKLPRSAFQLITVTDYHNCLNLKRFDVPGKCVADLQLLENMDWQALRRLMDK
jgi:hypothetical protein